MTSLTRAAKALQVLAEAVGTLSLDPATHRAPQLDDLRIERAIRDRAEDRTTASDALALLHHAESVIARQAPARAA